MLTNYVRIVSVFAGTALPEVLAPAGGWPQLIAAIAAGADAVYLGIRELNARARAENFDIQGSA